jgi:hypothetical protein
MQQIAMNKQKTSIPSLSTRLLSLIDVKVSGGKRFKQLEELTGIGARRWNAFSLGNQQPTIEMIEAVSKLWPQHAFWLATGIEDSTCGHTDPALRETKNYDVEDVAAELFLLKLNVHYKPETFLGLMKRSANAQNWKDWKSFADLFDDEGYITRLNITMKLLTWLSKEEEERQQYELEIMRLLFIENAPMQARAEEVFFDWKNENQSQRLRLHEPYLSQVLRFKKANSPVKFNSL